MLSCAIEKDHRPLQESVQLSSSWGKKVCTTLSILEKSCKWPIQRKLNKPSTTTVIMEPDLFLLCDKTWATPAVVSKEFVTPRSYRLQTPRGTVLRRNRRHLHFDTLPQPSTATPAPLAVTGVEVEPPRSVCKPIMTLDLWSLSRAAGGGLGDSGVKRRLSSCEVEP